VTSIEPLGEVYVAEGYHQNYWDGAGQQNRLLHGGDPT
jgi:peptide-methionine (S)-S-oxide reductase